MAAEILSDLSRATDSNSDPLAGALWYFYATGTTTPATVYTTAGLTVAHANPVVADSAGLFDPIYFDASVRYRGILKTAAGVTVQDIDPINASLFADLASTNADLGLALIGRPTVEQLINSDAPSRGVGSKWYADAFTYTEVAADPHITTIGGVMLQQDSADGVFSVDAISPGSSDTALLALREGAVFSRRAVRNTDEDVFQIAQANDSFGSFRLSNQSAYETTGQGIQIGRGGIDGSDPTASRNEQKLREDVMIDNSYLVDTGNIENPTYQITLMARRSSIIGFHLARLKIPTADDNEPLYHKLEDGFVTTGLIRDGGTDDCAHNYKGTEREYSRHTGDSVTTDFALDFTAAADSDIDEVRVNGALLDTAQWSISAADTLQIPVPPATNAIIEAYKIVNQPVGTGTFVSNIAYHCSPEWAAANGGSIKNAFRWACGGGFAAVRFMKGFNGRASYVGSITDGFWDDLKIVKDCGNRNDGAVLHNVTGANHCTYANHAILGARGYAFRLTLADQSGTKASLLNFHARDSAQSAIMLQPAAAGAGDVEIIGGCSITGAGDHSIRAIDNRLGRLKIRALTTSGYGLNPLSIEARLDKVDIAGFDFEEVSTVAVATTLTALPVPRDAAAGGSVSITMTSATSVLRKVINFIAVNSAGTVTLTSTDTYSASTGALVAGWTAALAAGGAGTDSINVQVNCDGDTVNVAVKVLELYGKA